MIENEGKYYLYRHVRLDTNQVFYIGIGTKINKDFRTIKSEYHRAYSKYRNTFWKNIVNKTDYRIDILFQCDDINFIKEKETEFIILYGRRNLDLGTLCNLTDGGERNKNKIVSQETRLRLSIANTGKILSEERKEQIRISSKGKTLSKESREKVSKNNARSKRSLKDEEIEDICHLLVQGKTYSEIKSVYPKISTTILSGIRTKKTYKYISSKYNFPKPKHPHSEETKKKISENTKIGMRDKEIAEKANQIKEDNRRFTQGRLFSEDLY